MKVIEEIGAERRQLLDALRKNGGDINLRIFEDFYPDEAHFIYELLQNAEDAGASEASFELTPDQCVFVHNGRRHFDERDIRGITGIFNSSKRDDADKIGKFGVGFKSVFVYTDTPIVYSRDYSFRISQLVLPESVPQHSALGEKTRFEFPFNAAKKAPALAFAEVKAGLQQLSETTLLFLSNLQRISWRIEGRCGEVVCVAHSDMHFEMRKEVEGGRGASSHWLRFTAPVVGLERQRVALAYELAFLGEQRTFSSDKPLSAQFKVVPAARGCVAVFFPAEKETSGLRFHLHAPFAPELSRASIKDTPANQPLFQQLATLAAHSLHGVKALGLLTGEFLAVLPNSEEALPERYKVIRQRLIHEMREQPLTPTSNGGHAPARTLLQARAALKELLTPADLAFLLGREDNPRWAVGATQRNSLQDRFLSSLQIAPWDINQLIKLLRQRANDTESDWHGRLDPAFMDWLGRKSDEWHQMLYAALYQLADNRDDIGDFSGIKIVRLSGGSYSVPDAAYFPSGPTETGDPFPRVRAEILQTGNKRAQQADARKFLEAIGVRNVGESDQIELILQQRYATHSEPSSDEVYLADLKRFMAFVERNPGEKEIFHGRRIFRFDGSTSARGTPAQVYLDEPIKETGLRHYFEKLTRNEGKRWALSTWYWTCGIEKYRLLNFAVALGCTDKIPDFVVPTQCWSHPDYDYLSQVPGERATNPINLDYKLSKTADALLGKEDEDFSRLVWRTMCGVHSKFLWAIFQKNTRNGARKKESSLVYRLRDASWIPLKDGRFVPPREACREDLLSGFTFDSSYEWLKLVRFGEVAEKRSVEYAAKAKKRNELGFSSDEALVRAQEFAKLPQEEQERFLEEHRRRSTEPPEEFPDRPVRNGELRGRRVREEAGNTPLKESQIRERCVPVGYEEAKTSAQLYLKEQYTNSNGVMFCQACKTALPFKLPSGSYYFEAVEAVPGLSKRFRETFLALCPNHAAMFRHANTQKDDMREVLEVSVGQEIELSLGGNKMTLLFTQPHIADIKACLASLSNEELSGAT